MITREYFNNLMKLAEHNPELIYQEFVKQDARRTELVERLAKSNDLKPIFGLIWPSQQLTLFPLKDNMAKIELKHFKDSGGFYQAQQYLPGDYHLNLNRLLEAIKSLQSTIK